MINTCLAGARRIKRIPSLNSPSVCASSPPRLFGSSSISRSSAKDDSRHDYLKIPPSRIRNITITAHIDHGKSSLTSQLLRSGDASNVDREDISMLDTLSVERERGITVKATAASLSHSYDGERHLVNLFDSPGHVDFTSEVSRTLDSVETSLLLIDSAAGVQAQTLGVLKAGREAGCDIVPVLTKVDRCTPEEVDDRVLQVASFLGCDIDDVILTSARDNVGMKEVLDAVCGRGRPPVVQEGAGAVAKVVDSFYDPKRGAVATVKVERGTLKEAGRVKAGAVEGEEALVTVQEVGILRPGRERTGALSAGMLGYAVLGARGRVEEGDYLTTDDVTDFVRPGRKEKDRSVLYANVHPKGDGSFDDLLDAVEKLGVNDKGLEISKAKTGMGDSYLGPGIRVGFMGMLHSEVFRARLEEELGVESLITSPKVVYRVEFPKDKRLHSSREGEVIEIEDLGLWPEGQKIKVLEPTVSLQIISPHSYAGPIMDLLTSRRGHSIKTSPIDSDLWTFEATVPWGEVVVDFHDELKNLTKGFASYSVGSAVSYETADLLKVEIALNGDPVDALSFVCHKDAAESRGREACKRLAEVVERQQFKIAVQARAGGRIVARSTVQAYRKDVLNKSGKMVGGGDISRKKKLLEKQKSGKKRAAAGGKVRLSQAAFNSVIGK